ncbi:MAG TPA: hypothetical protein VGB37_07650, partial [Candidatus Lokiarchaeia archaeon]
KKYFRTTLLDCNFIEKNVGKKSLCPSYIQEYIKPEFELRIYYLMNCFYSIKIQYKNEYIDIRDIPKNDLNISKFGIPYSLRNNILLYCKSLGLNYCCFDFVFKDKQYYLLDITSNGSWAFYEDEKKMEISKWFAEVLIKNEK